MHALSRPEVRRAVLLLLPSLLVLLSVVATTAAAAWVQVESIRESSTARVRDVATSLAALDAVRDAVAASAEVPVGEPAPLDHPAVAEAQSLATIAESASGVAYVVVADARAIRLTHPDPAERGRPVRTDTSTLRTGAEYLGTDVGPTGRTLRVKVPITGDDGRIAGMVAVGILEGDLSDAFVDDVLDMLPWTVGALAATTVASAFVSLALLRRFRRSDDDARELASVRRTALALREQAHEFDTRIHVVRGLLAHGDADDALAYVDRIAPHAVATREDDELPPLLRATTEALRAELAESGATLEADIRSDGELDDDALLVLANLCRNAGEAGARRVRVRIRAGDGRVAGSVDDDGPGVAADEVARVFRRGYSTKTDRGQIVRGIGLDLVRRTVAAHGGSVEVGRSDMGGARFAFEMEAGA